MFHTYPSYNVNIGNREGVSCHPEACPIICGQYE
jgi:hypothetical protein